MNFSFAGVEIHLDRSSNTYSQILLVVSFVDVLSWQVRKTALILAIEYGHIDIVKYLLMAGADTEIKDCEYDSTALMWASTNDDAAVVKLLLRSGANMDVKDKEGQTALGCAHANGNKEVAALLQLWKPRPCA